MNFVDNITKNIVNGFIRNQKNILNINIPITLVSIFILYYYSSEIWVCDSNIEYWNRKLSVNKRCISITSSNITNKVRYVAVACYDSPQIIYGINSIILNNQYCKYKYYWTIKIHTAQTVYELWPCYMMIGFAETDIGRDLTYKYCSDGNISTVNRQHSIKFARKFGEKDMITVCLNTYTMQLQFNVNKYKGASYILYEEMRQRIVRLQLIIFAPNVEIELINFDRHKI